MQNNKHATTRLESDGSVLSGVMNHPSLISNFLSCEETTKQKITTQDKPGEDCEIRFKMKQHNIQQMGLHNAKFNTICWKIMITFILVWVQKEKSLLHLKMCNSGPLFDPESLFHRYLEEMYGSHSELRVTAASLKLRTTFLTLFSHGGHQICSRFQ